MGYTRCEQVDGVGQFALRGGIFDVFPPQNENPVRIELWGNEIETISLFDTASQRRVMKLKETHIIPATERLFDAADLAASIERLARAKGVSAEAKEHLEADAEAALAGGELAADKYLGIMHGGDIATI